MKGCDPKRAVWVIILFWVANSLSPIVGDLLAQPLSNLPIPQRITDREGLPQAFVPGIVQDRQGFMWIATRDGLCRYDGNHFKVFQPDPDGRPSLTSTGLESLFLDHRGRIWITSERGDIDLFDPRTEKFTNFSHRIDYQRAMANRRPYRIFVDRQDRLWIAMQSEGLIRFDLGTNQIHQFRHQPAQPRSLGTDSILQVAQAANGIVWIATRAGLERFNESTNDFHHYRHRVGDPSSLPDDPLCGLQVRPNGEVLTVSQRYVARLDPRTGRFISYPLPAYCPQWWLVQFALDRYGTMYFHQNGLLYRFTDQRGPEVVAKWDQYVDQCASLAVDRSQVLWVGTTGTGLRKYDLQAGTFQSEPYRRNFYLDILSKTGVSDALLRTTLAGLNSYSFRYALDRQQNLWFNVGSSDVYRINLNTKQTERMPLPQTFNEGDNINAYPAPLATDSQNRMWALHDSLVWWYSRPERKWIAFPHVVSPGKTSKILTFVADERALWLATDQKGLWRLDKATGQLRQYAHQPDNPLSLSNNSLFCLSTDPDDSNILWIGTFGSGLCRFDKRTGRFRRFTQKDGLPNNVIYSVIPDQQGSLWMGTNKGICQLNRKTFSTRNYTRADGLLADEFNRFHWLQLPGRSSISMGGLAGITTFDPSRVGEDSFDPRVELTDLLVNNQPMSLTLTDSLPIQAVGRLTLPYNQNFITAEFSALQFNRSGKNRYRYRLAGLEEDWKKTDLPIATYTNLPANNYVLLLNATNTSGRWSPYVRRLVITIRPPIWATWWARVLYALAVGGLILFANRIYLNRLRMRQRLALKQQETEQLRAVDEMKSNFFANVTHEFRTPLTLILAPTERLTQNLHHPDDQKYLSTIHRNANQLLGLVNQLLDFSKLEAGALPVVEVRSDLGEFIRQTVETFREMAESKGIGLTVDQQELASSYWFDADKLERILYNLLANALKFTDAGGKVQVAVTSSPSADVEIRVTDTGWGIPTDRLSRLFDRYYRGESVPGVATPGTGLGLALVSELVNLQKGQISVTSEVGRGTCFVIALPYRVGTPASSEVIIAVEKTFRPEEQGTPTFVTDDHALVLIVEDNAELARFIEESLPADYRIRRASDGQQGWELALAEVPDLILSDVTMPVMDGFALCQKLKTDLRTSHIPVVMLTAKASLDSRLAGLTLGADDYLVKPFHVAELVLRVRNQLEGKYRLREQLRAQLTQLAKPDSDRIDPIPVDPFLEQIYTLLDAHLDDSTLVVEQLLKPLGMSRMALYRKLKSLTGLAPMDVIRLHRLRRATDYLRQGQSVSETASMVGFGTASHFIKVFRAQYDLTPAQFARQADAP